MCNCKTPPQIHTFGAGGGGGKKIIATTSFKQINIKCSIYLWTYLILYFHSDKKLQDLNF
jgi:hypothetical protein